jgi:hypothetical protein
MPTPLHKPEITSHSHFIKQTTCTFKFSTTFNPVDLHQLKLQNPKTSNTEKMQNYYIDTIIHHIISPQYFSSSSSSSSAFLSTVYNGFEFHDPEVLHLNHNSPHHNQPTGSKSISTHWKSKSKSNPPEIKIKINPPENKNKNQPTVNLLRRRPMVSTEIPETSHGFH